MAKWYEIRAAAEGDGHGGPVVFLYDEIGFWGTTAKDFAEELKALGPVSALTVRINSGGGEVFAGIAIHNLLRSHPARVTVKVDGIAASIASLIAMAGDTVEMPANAMMMIHDPSWGTWGTAEDLRETAGVLDQMKKALVAAYTGKTGLPEEEIGALMAATTWMTAAEAKAKGFADTVTGAVDATAFARADPGRFARVPAAVAARLRQPDPPPPPPPTDREESSMSTQAPPPPADALTPADIITLCDKAGFPELTAGLARAGATRAQADAAIKDAGAVKDACDRARTPALARNLIQAVANGMSVEAATAIVNDTAALRDQATVTDTTHSPGTPPANAWAGAVAKLK